MSLREFAAESAYAEWVKGIPPGRWVVLTNVRPTLTSAEARAIARRLIDTADCIDQMNDEPIANSIAKSLDEGGPAGPEGVLG